MWWQGETVMYWLNTKMKVVDWFKLDGLCFLFTSNYVNQKNVWTITFYFQKHFGGDFIPFCWYYYNSVTIALLVILVWTQACFYDCTGQPLISRSYIGPRSLDNTYTEDDGEEAVWRQGSLMAPPVSQFGARLPRSALWAITLGSACKRLNYFQTQTSPVVSWTLLRNTPSVSDVDWTQTICA